MTSQPVRHHERIGGPADAGGRRNDDRAVETRMRRARGILRDTFGFTEFRPLQEDVIRTILSGQDTFVLMPTGGGKSLCFQIPALALDGMTVVISPLIALMKDQVDALTTAGVAATYINSSLSPAEINQRQQAVARGEVKLLYVAPERFATPRFIQLIQHAGVSLFAIDEAHCISEWGHDFRPEYRELRRIRAEFPESIVAAFTATATERVQADIRAQLGLRSAAMFRASFNRPNLFYEVREKRNTYAQILDYLNGHRESSGIIYCGSRSTTEDIAERLRRDGFSAAAYHAGLSGEERDRVQEAFVRDDVRIVVATIAFGMGIDKPDVRFVLHHDLPRNLEGYYQESGRAGRDGERADCILFYSYADVARIEYLLAQKPTEALQAAAAHQLREMSRWAEERECRRRALLAYLGEDFDGQEGLCCDNCRNPAEMKDYTIATQKYLSCVKRTGERFGSAYVIDVLRGSKAERIVRLGHDRLSTHGIGTDMSKHEWQYLARELVKRGYVEQNPENYNVVRILEPGYDVLFRGAVVMLPSAPEEKESRKSSVAEDQTVAYPELFQSLRALRKRLADERGVPPYVVFPDSTLRAMTAALPADQTAFLRVPGVGQRRAADFGGAFLEEIRAFVQRTGARPVVVEQPAPLLRERPRGLGATVQHTIDMFREGLSLEEIADERGLSIRTIESHIVDAIEHGVELDWSRLVRPEADRSIRTAISAIGDEPLRAIMDATFEAFTWAEIKFVRAAVRAERTSSRQGT